MKKCEQCGAELNDTTTFCTKCGAKMERTENGTINDNGTAETQSEERDGGKAAGKQQNPNSYQSAYNQQAQHNGEYTYRQHTQPDPYDHTSEFAEQDISANKVVAMLTYLMGVAGIVIGLIAGCKSDYAAFHARQAMKFKVISVLLGIVAGVLFWTFIIPIAAFCLWVALWVCKVMAFFSVCNGKACEPHILRHLDFLN